MIEPLKIKNFLDGNPKQAPQFGSTVKARSGDSITVADPRASRALISLMDMNAVIGGAASHFGGPAAFAEIISAVHGYMFMAAEKLGKPWYELFHFVNDAGHCENGIYALKANYQLAGLNFEKLKGFRSIESVLTGHGEAHLFPEGVFLSNGPLGSAFPQAQGLAMADAQANINRTTLVTISDGACMEGEAREAMAAIPGFAAKGQLAPLVMIISDNNTKLSGRIDQESFSMQASFQALQSLGWKLITVEQGHNLQKVFSSIEEAVSTANSNPKQPVALHVKTIKGYGTKKTAESSSGAHGFPLKSASELPAFLSEIYNGEKYPGIFDTWISELQQLESSKAANAQKPQVPEEKIQVGVSTAMIECRKQGLPIVSITSDLPGSTGTAAFRKEFPKDSIDVGVAEANMISVAAGYSKVGFVPIVDTFAQFGVTKGALPLTMASLSHAPMICIFSHTGFQDAADGASHQALSYLAMLSSIPHVDVYCLTCSEEAHALVKQSIEKFTQARKSGEVPHSTVFFLGRENFPKSLGAKSYKLGEAQVLFDNIKDQQKRICLVASGSLAVHALKAANELHAKGVGVCLVNPSAHNHLDMETLHACLKKADGNLLVAEDHQQIGGLGSQLCFELAKQGVRFQVAVLAVQGEFGQSAYTSDELYAKHGLDSASMVRAALKLLP